MPRISVCIPTYRRPDLLAATLDSVLAQRAADFEVVVVDDGSPEPETGRLLARYGARVRALRLAHGGIARAKNAAVAAARGELLAFCDHDDLWAPDKLARQTALIDADPAVGLVYGRYRLFGPDGRDFKVRPRRTPAGDVFRAVLDKVFLQTSTVLLRRSLWEAAGPFDPRYRLADDLDFFLRATFRTRVRCLRAPLVRYRVHPGNTSRQQQAPREYAAEILSIYETWLAPEGPAAAGRTLAAAERRLLQRRVAKYRFNLARFAWADGDREAARAQLDQARRLAPGTLRFRLFARTLRGTPPTPRTE